ncbi:MAG: PIN domain-containing protein [Deltaproteobacteria bacterium]|nr:PIN domain-containing protein [Deltaproteobacteria bacterium]
MRVLVDTCIWSLALRRRRRTEREKRIVDALEELIRELRVVMICPVRQEILSGIRVEEDFVRVRDRLRAFPDLALEPFDFELAAEYYNRCRAIGIQGSNTDLLLCALAVRRHLAVFTVDRDFERFHARLGVALFVPAPSA